MDWEAAFRLIRPEEAADWATSFSFFVSIAALIVSLWSARKSSQYKAGNDLLEYVRRFEEHASALGEASNEKDLKSKTLNIINYAEQLSLIYNKNLAHKSISPQIRNLIQDFISGSGSAEDFSAVLRKFSTGKDSFSELKRFHRTHSAEIDRKRKIIHLSQYGQD